jgi:hypothetical protein
MSRADVPYSRWQAHSAAKLRKAMVWLHSQAQARQRVLSARSTLASSNKPSLPDGTTLHDLRRFVATTLEDLEVGQRTIGHILGHEAGNVTEGYIKRNLPTLRRALEKLEQALWEDHSRWGIALLLDLNLIAARSRSTPGQGKRMVPANKRSQKWDIRLEAAAQRPANGVMDSDCTDGALQTDDAQPGFSEHSHTS